MSLKNVLRRVTSWMKQGLAWLTFSDRRGKIRAVVLDMDGTLLDSEPLHFRAYQQLLATHGINYTQEDNKEFLGLTDHAMSKVIVERYGLKTTVRAFVEAKEAILAHLLKDEAHLRPGVLKLLNEAHSLGLSLAIASCATRQTIELVVTVLKIRSYFKVIVSADDVVNGKPAPDVYLLAAKRLGIAPRLCLGIDDSRNGVLAAKAAGMHCVAVPCNATRHEDHSPADVILNSLDELELTDWA